MEIDQTIQEKIRSIDEKIRELEANKMTLLKTLEIFNKNISIEGNQEIKMTDDVQHSNISKIIEPMKINEALLNLFEREPFKHWTTSELKKEFKQMIQKGEVTSKGKNALWSIHNSVRLLLRKEPAPIVKIGEGRNAYYMKSG